MDAVAEYNQARWKALAEANALFTRPRLDLDVDTARAFVDPTRLLGDINKKDVLCLAGGGGQQSAAFSLLGANVTVVDLSAEQIERDLQVAKHYGLDIQTIRADMRDLSALEENSFDVVHQAYSLNFVPNCIDVFAQAARARESTVEIAKPVEYRHTLSTMVNGLIGAGFSILHVSDSSDMHPDAASEPGTWDHFVAYAPPWLSFLARLEN